MKLLCVFAGVTLLCVLVGVTLLCMRVGVTLLCVLVVVLVGLFLLLDCCYTEMVRVQSARCVSVFSSFSLLP